MSNLLNQLAKLDVDNDDHWTADGLPRLDALKDLTGAVVTRDEIKKTAPKFSRKNPTLTVEPVAAPAPVKAPIWGNAVEEVDLDAGKEDHEGNLETEVTGEVVGALNNLEEEVEVEYAEALVELDAARLKFEDVSKRRDMLIMRKAEVTANVDPALAIQQFQKSQTDQRTVAAKRNAALKSILSPKEYQAIIKA